MKTSKLSPPITSNKESRPLTTALRTALGKLQDDLAAAFAAGQEKLTSSDLWSRLTDEQRATLTASCQLTPPDKAAIGTEEEILTALQTRTLADRRNLLDAVPQRFTRALEEASALLEPEAVRLTLPGATIHTIADLDPWFAQVREQVEEQLKTGPAIL